MFEKIVDFHNAKFNNLWRGYSCECFVNGDNVLVNFRKDKQEISICGDEANDLLDFVLSYYYENENTKMKNEIKKCKQKIEAYSLKNYELRKQLERYENGETNGETMHDIIVGLNEAVRKRNKKIEELEQKLSQLT